MAAFPVAVLVLLELVPVLVPLDLVATELAWLVPLLVCFPLALLDLVVDALDPELTLPVLLALVPLVVPELVVTAELADDDGEEDVDEGTAEDTVFVESIVNWPE